MLERPKGLTTDQAMQNKIKIQELKHRAEERMLTVNDLAKEVALQLQNRAEETALELLKKFDDENNAQEITAGKILSDQVKEEAEKIRHMAREESLIEKNLAHEQAALFKLTSPDSKTAERDSKLIIEKSEEHAKEITHKVLKILNSLYLNCRQRK
jgi:hypothetical protein